MTGDSATATNGAEEPVVPDPSAIGSGIRQERLRRGLTLAQLADRTNLTVSALSQIERGASDPSISSLRRIAQAFDVPMFQFLVSASPRDVVVRRDHRVRIGFPGRDLEYELVSPDTSGEFEMLSLVLAPGAASSATATPHPSEEVTMVLRGRVRCELAGETYDLDTGDSVKIHRGLDHRFVNDGTDEAELLLVISPPTF